MDLRTGSAARSRLGCNAVPSRKPRCCRQIAFQMAPGQWHQDQEDADPPDTGQCQWRDVTRDIAREHDIAGPEQRGQAEQEVRLVEKPAERRLVLRFGVQETGICARNAGYGKLAYGIGAMRSHTTSPALATTCADVPVVSRSNQIL